MDIKTEFKELLHLRKTQYASLAVVFAAVLPIFVTLFTRNEYYVGHVFSLILIYSIYASSWNLLAYSGQGSLGHAAFLGIGGFASALLAVRSGVPPIISLFVGALVSAGIGFLIGLTCVRLKAWFLGMVTFGFSIIIVTIFTQFDSIFRGVDGFATKPMVPQGLPFYYATLVITASSLVTIFWVMKSKWGLAFKAVRENEFEAKMIGINTGKYKLLAFIISTFFAGLAGGLWSQLNPSIQLDIFGIEKSFLPLIMSVIGGLATIEGPIIGSLIMVSIEEFDEGIYPILQPLGAIFPGVSNVGPHLVFAGLGLFLILVVIFLPKGISSLIPKVYGYLREVLSEAK